VEAFEHSAGFDVIDVEKVLDFLPYPFLLSEARPTGNRQIFVNKKFEEEIGYTIEEIPTIKHWFIKAYPDPEYRKAIEDEWRRVSEAAVASGLDAVSVKARIQTRNFGQQWYEVKTSLTGRINFVAFININGEIMREEELELLNENKNRTLSILSHDLRTPLNNLTSIIQLSKKGVLTELEYRESLNAIATKVSQLSDFLETTLQWTRSNFDHLLVTKHPVDLRRIVDSILHVYQHSFSEKEIAVAIEMPHSIIIESDSEVLSVVIRNLLSNAIKFTSQGGLITISSNDTGSAIRIQDNGTGMNTERIQKIQEKNYQSETGTSGEKGLGLGLQLCQQLLSKINGYLQIESVVNKGTIVTVHL
jgi:signal transduction histidine kinase